MRQETAKEINKLATSAVVGAAIGAAIYIVGCVIALFL